MCKSCDIDANYFHSVYCVYDHLATTHPVLWLRDSSRIRSDFLSRNLLSSAGDVLAIWNAPPGKGWALRIHDNEAIDERPDPQRGDFVDLSDGATRFQILLDLGC
ncbi:hypothetical protein BSR00_24560 [Serratia liquefaciens]|nr:hypothetical protein BSR00_24560 [Serratia liquefaciens]RYM76552.1 hypothetical protein BSR01_21100 [Serratia liquefaciens]